MARKLQISHGELVEVASARGRLCLQAKLDRGMHSREVFAPMHWNDQYASSAKVGVLLDARTDPWSGQPESKLLAVSLTPLSAGRWFRFASRESLPVDGFGYWHRSPLSHGHSLTAALPENNFDLLRYLQSAMPDSSVVEFHDEREGIERYLLRDTEGDLIALAFAAPASDSLPETEWCEQSLGLDAGQVDWQLLAGHSLSGGDKGSLVCSCFEVGEKEIARAIDAGCASVESLGASLRCGSNCGSCIPELRQMLANHAEPSDSEVSGGKWQEAHQKGNG